MGNNHSTTRRSKPITPLPPLMLNTANETDNETDSETENIYSKEGKELLKQMIVTLESNELDFGRHHDVYRKSLECRMKDIIGTPKSVTLKIIDQKNSQSDDKYSLTGWVMNNEFESPDKKTCEKLHTLVLKFTIHANFEPDDSFSKKFSNLNSLLFNRVSINNEILSMLSKFPLLKFLSLYNCHVWSSDSLSKIFDYCTTLKELYITKDDSSDVSIDLIIPRQLKIIDVTNKGSIELTLNRSLNLQSLSAKSNYVDIIVTSQLAFLEKVNLVGDRFKILGKPENLFTNVKELYIDAFGCYSVFGTLSDSTTIPCLNEVPKFTFGTYHLNFLMIQHIKKVMIETYSDRDTIFCALSSINGNKTTVDHICVQNGKHMESKHDLSQGPKIVKYSPGKEPTEMEYNTLFQWPKNERLCYTVKVK